MWNEIALEELDGNTNESTKFCFNKRTKLKYEQKHQILVESMAGLGLIWRENIGGSSNFGKISKHHEYY
jgi:hypothetical protein